MILTKKFLDSVSLELLIKNKIKENKTAEFLLIFPTNRKIRAEKREIISRLPNSVSSKINLETLGTFSTNILFLDENSKSRVLSEAAASILLKQSFQETDLKYFSAYKNEIPFGTLERIRNVISEYKKHGVTPSHLRQESESLTGSEKFKAIDIANIFENYRRKFKLLDVKEIGDVYESVNEFSDAEFELRFRKLYPSVQLIIINGFDEFTQPEIEIINKASNVKDVNLFISFDYFKNNPLVFSHLDKCYKKLIEKGFKEINDTSESNENNFHSLIKVNLFSRNKIHFEDYEEKITVISALTRAEEVESVAKEIKNLIIDKGVEPNSVCVIFNLIQNYSPLIRDVFQLYGLPFNLTDRFSLKTSSPVISVLNLLEILENDFYYKNIFRALSSGIFGFEEIDQSALMKTAFNLKIISGYENWKNSLHDAILRCDSYDDEDSGNLLERDIYQKALNDIQILYKNLLPFDKKLTLKEFYDKLTDLIFSIELPSKIINNGSVAVEENVKAVSTFLDEVKQIFELLEMEFSPEHEFSLPFLLNNLRTIVSSSRYNIKEKPGYGIQITTPNEIRGLQFDYLFISGLCDGDLPTRYNPEIFFSGSYLRSERIHQTEERYAFYQSLCSWKKHLYFSFPLQEDSKELVKSSFLSEFLSVFIAEEKNESSFDGFIFSKEDLLAEAGRLGYQKTKEIYSGENVILEFDKLKASLDVNNIRLEMPFGDSEYTGNVSIRISTEAKENLDNYRNKEYSISQLETYAKCPFKYFTERVLKLKPLKEPSEDVEALEMGSLLHSILFKFYTELKKVNIIMAKASDEDFNRAVDLIFKIAEESIKSVNFSSPVTFYEKEKILGINGCRNNSILYKFLCSERENQDGFVPQFFEIGFGQSVYRDKGDNFLLKAGKVNVTGKIDRIDIKDISKKFKVVDYKSGGKKISIKDLNRGIELQLPLYMYAAKELMKTLLPGGENKYIDYEPAGAELYSLKYNEQYFGKKLVTQWTRRNISEKEKEDIAAEANNQLINVCISSIENYVTDIAKGKFNLSKLENREKVVCSFCDFKAVCRIQDVN